MSDYIKKYTGILILGFIILFALLAMAGIYGGNWWYAFYTWAAIMAIPVGVWYYHLIMLIID